MASSNLNASAVLPKTFEGGNRALNLSPYEVLCRSIMSCLLWEDSFYEDGETIADRIARLVNDPKLTEEEALEVLRKAKFESKLRHAPLYLLTLFAARGWLKSSDVTKIITRADDLTEILALYLRGGKKPIPNQLRKGVAEAFRKFDEYQLAKYDRKKAVKLRDVLRITRPKPESEEQSALWKKVVSGTLTTPDTWEVAISACGNDNDKKAIEFVRLLEEGKLGDLAFLRNLRLMMSLGISQEVIRNHFAGRKWGWILPYQFLIAARYASLLEDVIEKAMFQCIESQEKIECSINLLVDGSGSMDDTLSKMSEVTRFDTAVSLAIILREVCSDIRIWKFDDDAYQIPLRRGFALRYVFGGPNNCTNMWGAVKKAANHRSCDVMIVITDEQTRDNGNSSLAKAGRLIIVNVAGYERGVSYDNRTIHINGWSDNIVNYVRAVIKSNSGV